MFKDVQLAKLEPVMRYAGDGALVCLRKIHHILGYHIFLSHSQQDGGDQVAHIKKELEKFCSTIEIFTDVAAGRKENGLDAKGSLDTIVAHSDVMLCYLTKTYFTRKWCVLELKMALEAGKAVVFVFDTDERHGGMTIEQVLSYATEQATRAASDKEDNASNLVNMCTGKVSPRQVAAERALTEALQASADLSDALAERAAADEEAQLLKKACIDLHHAMGSGGGGAGGSGLDKLRRQHDAAQQTMAEWRTTEGELLLQWIQALLPMLLDPAHAGGRPVIPWYRDAHCKLVSLKRIVQEALGAGFDKSHFADVTCDGGDACARCNGSFPVATAHKDGALPKLCVAGETSSLQVQLPPAWRSVTRADGRHANTKCHLFVSPHHPSSATLQQKLIWRLPNLVCSTDELQQCTHMLVVLDAGERGDAQADSPALNNAAYRHDILAALNSGVAIITLHVGPTAVEDYMWELGTALWRAGLFNPIAIPCPASVLLPDGASTAAREDPELEEIALVRVGKKICVGAPAGGHRVMQAVALLTSSGRSAAKSAASAGKVFAHKAVGSVRKHVPTRIKMTGNPLHAVGRGNPLHAVGRGGAQGAGGVAAQSWGVFGGGGGGGGGGSDGKEVVFANPLFRGHQDKKL